MKPLIRKDTRMRILLVDDERLARVYTQSMIEELFPCEPLTFYHAKNSSEARQILMNCKLPSIAFVDYKMPHCNGVDFITSIKDEYKSITWVMLSGYDLTSYSKELEEANIKYILYKPSSISDISKIMNDIMEDNKNGNFNCG